MGWHKNLTEKTLKSLGISNYGALWFAFAKGCIIGELLFIAVFKAPTLAVAFGGVFLFTLVLDSIVVMYSKE
jgi:hypothetical protein